MLGKVINMERVSCFILRHGLTDYVECCYVHWLKQYSINDSISMLVDDNAQTLMTVHCRSTFT